MKYLSKNKEERLQQLSLIIHNAKVYGVKVKQEWINELILSGKTYTHSDGTQAEYKEISKLCEC